MNRHRKPVTVADCIAAIRETGSMLDAAHHLGVSTSLVYGRLREADIDLDTLEPRVPFAFSAVDKDAILRRLIQRAVEIGIWHIDRHGDIQQYRLGDPWKGNAPNLLDDVRRRA